MQNNPRYRSVNQHGLPSHAQNNGIHYRMPTVFDTHESHGTLVHGGFGPEPEKITRVRNDAPIPSAARAREVYNVKVDVNPYGKGPDFCPWEQGQFAAMCGEGERANPYDPLVDIAEWDEWMDGFRSC